MSSAQKEQIPIPLGPQALDRLFDAVEGFGPQELVWASGYLAGMAAGSRPQPAVVPASEQDPWQILFATETGNSRRVAQSLVESFEKKGVTAVAVDVRDYRPAKLRKVTNVVIVAATHGLGDAPDGSEDFFEYVSGERAPPLPELNFAVLALGDSSYDDFCKVGRDIDARLEQLGATRIAQRIDCDVDFEEAAAAWSQTVLDYAVAHRPAQAPSRTTHLRAVAAAPRYDRANPFAAPVLVNQKITGRDSSKTVQHIELSLEDSGLVYEPGDSLGVMPVNPVPLVDEILALLGLDAKTRVRIDGHETDLHSTLLEKVEITTLSQGFIAQYIEVSGQAQLRERLAGLDGEALRTFLCRHQVADLLREFPARIDAQEFVSGLRKLTPRLYSISSSMAAVQDEVHLTVGRVQYEHHGRTRSGSASTFLARADGTVPVYVESNPHFRLPADPDAPLIMIGPGTGIAPFRAFLQQREESGAGGDNWLVFGDRQMRSDFLYQTELQRWRASGLLKRLDVAFSRDQPEKVYVQQRLRENAAELYRWLEGGAHVYVCGDAQRMAPDVHAALRDVIAERRGGSHDDAEDYLRELKRQHRYQRDVY